MVTGGWLTGGFHGKSWDEAGGSSTCRAVEVVGI
jgi:hypothetical protein